MEKEIQPFQPHWLCPGGMAQTIFASQFPGSVRLPPRTAHKIKVGPHCVLLAMELKGGNPDYPNILMAHGLGGCSESGYMRRVAHKFWKQGFTVFLLNHRGCGPGMGMSDTLWNGGVSGDMESVVQYIAGQTPEKGLLIVGFSLSGNVLLKYLGEGRNISDNVLGAYAVNPPIDLAISSKLLSGNGTPGIFNRYYMGMVTRQAEAIGECFPEAFHPKLKCRAIWDFDQIYTAPAAGFKDAEEYYKTCSSNKFLKSIAVPTTILCSKDDPMVPPQVFFDAPMNFNIELHSPAYGGHLGYIHNRLTPLGDHRWMDYALVQWARGFI